MGQRQRRLPVYFIINEQTQSNFIEISVFFQMSLLFIPYINLLGKKIETIKFTKNMQTIEIAA